MRRRLRERGARAARAARDDRRTVRETGIPINAAARFRGGGDPPENQSGEKPLGVVADVIPIH